MCKNQFVVFTFVFMFCRFKDKIPDTDVLQKADVPSLMSVLRTRRMRWLGHVSRMDDSRIPKQVLYGELSEGSRTRGRPKLRFKDQCKTTLKELTIDEKEWEVVARDRSEWRYVVQSGARDYEVARTAHARESRQKRKERQASGVYAPTLHNCVHCGRSCRARIGLISHERHCTKRILL